jgi:replicative DNA helicase
MDLDAERDVLGQCIIVPGDIDLVIGWGLQPGHFSQDQNRRIFDAILRVHEDASMVVDEVALAADLRRNNRLDQVGGTVYLAQLAIMPFQVETQLHQRVRMIIDHWRARQAISIQQVGVATLYQPQGTFLQETLESLEQQLWEVTHGAVPTSYVNAGQLAHDALTEMSALLASGQSITGLTTGFADLDAVITGYHAGDLVVLAGRPGMGKCLGRGTPVLRYDGTVVPVEAVRAGDLLMGPDSKPRRVLTEAKGTGPLWKITPTKGDPWICNWCHVLTMVHSSDNRVIDMSLDEYLKQGQKFKHQHKLFSVGVEFPETKAPLPIAPYALGLWLGDGTKSYKFSITKPDPEIRPALEELARVEGLRFGVHTPTGGSRCPELYIRKERKGHGRTSSLVQKLRRLFPDLKNLQIPQEYLVASEHDRLELLAGLVDTDGHLVSGCVEIAQKSLGIASGVMFLARSLGLRVTCRPKYVKGIAYQRMFISGDLARIPTRIPRKKLQPREQKKNALRTGFKVEPIGDGEYFGFELDGDGRFLLGDFTVTHNTAALCSSLLRATRPPTDGSPPPAAYLHSLEMPKEQIALRLVCSYASVEFQKIRLNKLQQHEWNKLFDACKALMAHPILIDDKPAITVAEIRSNVRKIKREIELKRIIASGLVLVAIDYLQLMRGEQGQGREREVASLTAGLKNTAKTEKVCMLTLAQLNRGVENRGGKGTDKQKRPQLQDLRESGAIEQDADTVMFLFRPKYYDKEVQNDTLEVIVEKNRNGPTCIVELAFEGSTMTVKSIVKGYTEFEGVGEDAGPGYFNDEDPLPEDWRDK